METTKRYTAFVGEHVMASGILEELLPRLKTSFDRNPGTLVLIFDDGTGEQIDFDLRGTLDEVLARHCRNSPQTGPGRPKLGVVSREITLLPRHWEWLAQQPHGASAAIRRLVVTRRGSGNHKGREGKKRSMRRSGSCSPWPAIFPAMRRPFALSTEAMTKTLPS